MPTRHLGFCPVCERDIRARDDLLVHHGYRRPGTGEIVGDCFGVFRPPLELSPLCCELYRTDQMHERVALQARVLEIEQDGPTLTLSLPKEDPEHPGRVLRDPYSYQVILFPQRRADMDERRWNDGRKSNIANLDQRVRHCEHEIRRMDRFIEDWQPKPLRSFEEAESEKRAQKDERKRVKATAVEEKIAAHIVRTQDRIDSAVRRRNAGPLRDIFESNKLREISKYTLSRNEALSLLERDNVWEAFGLGSAATGYAKEADVLSDMYYNFERKDYPWPQALGGGVAVKPKH